MRYCDVKHVLVHIRRKSNIVFSSFRCNHQTDQLMRASILILLICTQFVGVEGFLTAFIDLFPRQLRPRRELFTALVCGICFLVGLSMVTQVRKCYHSLIMHKSTSIQLDRMQIRAFSFTLLTKIARLELKTCNLFLDCLFVPNENALD